jgi:hypothetical protein
MSRADRERVLAAHVRRAALLEHLDRPRPDATLKGMPQHHYSVHHVVLDAVLRHGSVVLAALGRDERGDPQRAQPFDQTAQPAADRERVAHLREESADRVEHDAVRTDAPHGLLDPFQEGVEVELRCVLRGG